MNKKVDVLSSGATLNQNQSAEPTRKAKRESAAAWRDGEVEQDLMDALHQSESFSQGTPPSNTVPYNCNNTEYFKLLRFGVDSLYLSYQGELFFEVQERLTRLKQLAQHPEADQQALAQYAIGEHIFEVKDKGSSIFPFVITAVPLTHRYGGLIRP